MCRINVYTVYILFFIIIIFFYACKYARYFRTKVFGCGGGGEARRKGEGVPEEYEDIKKPSDREARTENPFLSGWLHKHNMKL